jgi:sRNA-binding carbon storage regulator CsrA
MLVLTRSHIGEYVNIYDGDGVYAGRVVLLEKGMGRVRLGFEFDEQYEIVRGEVDNGEKKSSQSPARKGRVS